MEEERQWQLCCSKTSPEMIKYLVQVLFGLLIVAFSMLQIANNTGQPEIYFSMLTGTVGYFFPHPQIKKADAPRPQPIVIDNRVRSVDSDTTLDSVRQSVSVLEEEDSGDETEQEDDLKQAAEMDF